MDLATVLRTIPTSSTQKSNTVNIKEQLDILKNYMDTAVSKGGFTVNQVYEIKIALWTVETYISNLAQKLEAVNEKEKTQLVSQKSSKKIWTNDKVDLVNTTNTTIPEEIIKKE